MRVERVWKKDRASGVGREWRLSISSLYWLADADVADEGWGNERERCCRISKPRSSTAQGWPRADPES
jgi:hypothetical protein